MTIYHVAPVNKAGVNTANTVMWEIRAAATRRVLVRELGLFVTTAPTTAPSFVLARTTNVPAGATNVAPIANDAADTVAAVAQLSTAWATTAPTFTTAGPFIRNMGLPVTAGAGIIWSFATPLLIPLAGGICIANLNAAGATLGAFGMYAVIDE
jgi:hypothetical protein